MKRLSFLICSMLLGSFLLNGQSISKVEPLSWWTGMNTPLTIMFYGENLQDAEVSILEEGLTINKVRNAESPNYLFVEVDVKNPGTYTFLLKKGRKKLKYSYLIEERRQRPAANDSFDPSDVIYLIMPDRFANGDPSNDQTDNTIEKADREAFFGRHGGDIQGIIDHLDYIADLGATAIWNTPLLLDNEPTSSYHGYACADYYHIDPRFGDNQLYKTFVEESHKRGLKVIMDMVPNHCGAAHWWMQDLPYQDWIHQFDTYTQSNFMFSTNMDINASKKDLYIMESGWFDTSMPDMNLDNPDLLQYFTQWAIWWIEYANLNGLRVDTYPYNEKIPMSQWCKAIRTEYPDINIVGEVWTRPASQVAYWEADADNKDGFNSNLPSVMDFPTQEALCQALSENGEGWNGGLTKVYASIADDYLYRDARRLLVFTGNHDTERIGDVVLDKNPERAKLAATLLLTMRGVPQMLYGEELRFLSKDQRQGHGGLRVDFPGGWQNDPVNLFDAAQRNDMQQDVFTHYRTLLNFRKNEPILHEGKTMHFLSRDNTYAYFRYTDKGAVFVFLNASDEDKNIPWENYEEIMNTYQPVGKNILTGKHVDAGQPLVIPALSSIVVKFDIPK